MVQRCCWSHGGRRNYIDFILSVALWNPKRLLIKVSSRLKNLEFTFWIHFSLILRILILFLVRCSLTLKQFLLRFLKIVTSLELISSWLTQVDLTKQKNPHLSLSPILTNSLHPTSPLAAVERRSADFMKNEGNLILRYRPTSRLGWQNHHWTHSGLLLPN